MKDKLIAKSSVTIHAPVTKVWETITNPTTVQKFMLGMQPVSDWKEGSELRWIGRHDEKKDDNAKGVILSLNKNKAFKFTFFYPGYGYPDEPTYYNTVVFNLVTKGDTTVVEVEQGDFAVFKEGETFVSHSQTFWDASTKILKELAEADK
jgi:uncharacterized protein YndB with AHSA1/START domain